MSPAKAALPLERTNTGSSTTPGSERTPDGAVEYPSGSADVILQILFHLSQDESVTL